MKVKPNPRHGRRFLVGIIMHYSDPDYDKERKLLNRRGKRLLKAGKNLPQPAPAKVRVQHLRDLKKLFTTELDE